MISIFISTSLSFANGAGSAAVVTFTLNPSNYNGFNISCNGGNDGSIDLTVTSGTAPYTFKWSNGAITEDVNSLTAGIYSVTVYDADNDSAMQSITLTQAAAMSVGPNAVVNASCFGGNNGSIDINVSGGVSPYTYVWSNGETVQDIDTLIAGNYTVTVTDANSCTASFSTTISEPSALVIASITPTNITCFGLSNGSIDLTPSGGTPPYTYLWSTGAITQDVSALGVGTYTVTVTDFNSCTLTASAMITQPPALTLVVADSTNISCNGGNDGAIDITVGGGTPGYNYSWSNGSTTQDVSSLLAGSYTVTVTDQNGCTITRTVVLSEPTAMVIVADSINNVSCNGGSDAELFITASGGVPTYTYLWSDASTLEDRSGLTAGVYTVTVTDQYACTLSKIFVVTEPTVLTNTLNSKTDVSCFGFANGTIDINVGGGTSPYTYLWSNGTTTQDVNSLIAGTYTVTVTDDNGCTKSLVTMITEPTMLLVTTVDSVDASCNGFNDGSIEVLASGGTSPYTYLWSNGDTDDNTNDLIAGTYTVTVTDAKGCVVVHMVTINEPPILQGVIDSVVNVSCNSGSDGQIYTSVSGGNPGYFYSWSNGASTQDIAGLVSGTYTLIYTDVKGCVDSLSTLVTQPTALSFSLTPSVFIGGNNVSCFGSLDGTITSSSAGGTMPYSYNWNNGNTSANLNGVGAGMYTVVLTDNNGCTIAAMQSLTEPDSLTTDLSSVTGTCASSNGSATSDTAYGGIGPYNYLWSTGATTVGINTLAEGLYTLTVTDVNACTVERNVFVPNTGLPVVNLDQINSVLCNGDSSGGILVTTTDGIAPYQFLWTDGSTSEDISNIPSGTYTLTVTDSIGCVTNSSFTVSQPNPINASLTTINSTCGNANGIVILAAAGGTGYFTYLWSNGSTNQNLINVLAGNYSVTVTDVNGCTSIDSTTLNDTPGPIITVDTVIDVLCNGDATGSAQITTSSGTAPYTYVWSNGSTFEDPSGLTAGTYTVIVTDQNNCTASTTIMVSQATAINLSISIVNTTCGVSNGIASVSASGGVPAYTYLWSNGNTTDSISGLASGSYTITVTDQNGCTKSAVANINDLGGPVVTLVTQNNVSCFGGNDGSIDVNVTGGVTPYTYLWSNGASVQDISTLAAGMYTLTVTDSNSCVTSFSVTITEPNEITIIPTLIHTTCGFDNGSIILSTSGGTGTLSFLWSNGETTSSIDSLLAGIYTVTVTDANSCTKSSSFVLLDSPGPVLAIDSLDNVSCFGFTDGAIYIGTSSGTAPFSYIWSNGITLEDNVGIAAGSYALTITDGNACTTSISSSLTQPAQILATVNTGNSTCGNPNGTATVTASGGVGAPFTYLWSNSSTNQIQTGLLAGIYTVTVTDASGCTAIASDTVFNTGGPMISIVSTTDVLCNSDSTGTIDIDVAGGTPPYNYLWSNGMTTQDLNSIPAGSYNIVVTDQNSCISNLIIVISEPPAIVISINSVNSTCGNANGIAATTVSGGVFPYTYLWSTGATSSSLSGLNAGTYTVTVTDANSCTKSNTVIILTSTPPAIALLSFSDVTCNGFDDGFLNILVSSGAPPYNYLWSNGATTEDLSAIGPGSYTVTVTDTIGCQANGAYVISEPDPLALSLTTVDATCTNNNGRITAVASGGVGSFTYLWSNGATTSSNNNLAAGTYTVTVTDLNGCIIVDSASIVFFDSPNVVLSAKSDVSCFGGNDGSISTIVSAGTPPYSFSWTNTSQMTQNITGLGAGNYTLTVTDDNGCTATLSVDIIQPSQLTVSTSKVDASCGNSNGSAMAAPAGGTPPYTYLWSNGNTTSSISGLFTGSYTITITDFNSCTVSSTVLIFNTPIPNISLVSLNNVSCNGGSDGSISIQVTSGVAPFTYLWSEGSTTQNVSGLAAASYTVTVSDVNSCTSSASYVIGQPSAVAVSVSGSDAICTNDNGSASAAASGGLGSYTYLWSNGQTTSAISNLMAGTYTVTVSDLNACTASGSVIVNFQSGPAISIISKTDNLCNGDTLGSINIDVIGGALPYTYAWTNTTQTVQDPINLGANTYVVTVTDNNGCTATVSVQINEPPTLSVTTSPNNTTCGNSNGSAGANVLGGTPPYNFLWSTGATTQFITGLAQGSYTVTVTDNAGCTSSALAIVSDFGGPVITVDSVVDILCNGDGNGEIYLSITAGAMPYTYLWSTGSTLEDLIALAGGTYTVTVTDSNTCATSTSIVVDEPAALALSFTVSQPTCGASNGFASANVTGGTFPFTYLWSTGSTNGSISGLNSGTYSVLVTDANNCVISDSTILLNSDLPVITLDSLRDVSCNGGNDGLIQISIANGTLPYTYLWADGVTVEDRSNLIAGQYTITVTDNVGCFANALYVIDEPLAISITLNETNALCQNNTGVILSTVNGGTGGYSYLWSTGDTTANITGLSSGVYTVTVTDENGCTESATEVISFTPAPVVSLVSKVDVLCAGDNSGSIDIDVTGGTPPYTYAWTNSVQVTQDLMNLPAFTYTVTVTDDNGCTATLSVTINEPAPISLTAIASNATCGNNNGSVITSIAGGTAPYTYLWSDGSTLPFLTNQAQGVYTVIVTDNNSCTSSAQAVVNDFGLPAIAIDSVNSVTCNGSSDGSVFVTVSGGIAPYTYLWSNGETSQSIINVAAATYTLTVTDSLLCINTISIPVPEPAAVAIGLSKSDPTCASQNGVISANVSGGTVPYSYLWSNGSTFSSVAGLGAGTYTVTVTDANGCVDSSGISLIGSTVPVINLDSVVNVSCNGSSDGSINIEVSAGVSPYTYLWSDGVTLEDRSGLPAGQYTITVTDSLGCIASSVFIVNQPSALSITLNKIDAVCQNNNGSISSSSSGGTGAVSVIWSTGDTTSNISGLSSGTYTVTVTDQKGCSVSSSAVILFTPGPSVTLNTVTDVLCSGDSTGAIDINITGGSMPFTYFWTNTSQTTEDINNLPANNYQVLVTDSNLCTEMFSVTVNEPTPIVLTFDVNNASCGSPNGSVKANVNGGIAGYTYLWSTGATTDSISGISAGNYTVTVTDANGCTELDLVTINNSGIPNVILDNITNVLCNGDSTGAISISVNNGQTPYSFVWSNGATSEDISALSAGVYTVIVTDSLGCSDSSSFNVNQPLQLGLSIVKINASCNLSNGSLTANPSNGVFPYSYLWSTGDTIASISALNTGLYTVTVTDANNCAVTDTVSISNAGAPALFVDSIVQVSCFGGSDGAINVLVNGGSAPYSFFWSNGATNQNVAGLVAATYTVTVSDINGCTSTASITVTQPQDITVNVLGTPASCGFANGTATAIVNGGIFPYTYLWSNGASGNSALGLAANIYVVTVTDFNNCTKTASVLIQNLGAPSVSLIQKTDVSCFGLADGSIDIDVTGAGAPFTYLWSNGATTEDISGLIAGTYSVTVSDSNGCVILFSVPINQPGVLQLNTSGSNPSCGNSNGVATVLATGGTGPYTYLWSTGGLSATIGGLAGGTYTVTVTDAKGCSDTASISLVNTSAPIVLLNSLSNISCNGANDGFIAVSINSGSPGFTYAWSNTTQTTDSIFNLAPGNYNLTVTDSVGCQGFASYTIGEPDVLMGSVSTTIALCNGSNGTATATVNGGTIPYSYLWSNGGTTGTIVGLTAGTYTVTVTDAEGCTFSAIGGVSNTGGPVITVVDTNNVLCFGSDDGSIILSVSGGTPFMSGEPYIYVWNDTSLTGPTAIDLEPGVYIVTIIDSIGCQTTQAFNIGSNPEIIINDSIPQINGVFNISCSGETDGAIFLDVSGGVPPFSYIWSTGDTIKSIDNLAAATYTVTIRDSEGCIALRNFILNEPPPIIADAGLDQSICGTFMDSLHAFNPLYGTGTWSVLQGSGTFFNPNAANTIVNGLSSSINLLQWTVSDGVCADSSTISIIVRDSIFAVTGADILSCDRKVVPTALDPQFGFGYWTVLFGNAVIVDSSSSTPTVLNYSTGPNVFQWTVKNGECIDSATVTVTMRDSSECLEPIDLTTGFTPNNDGKNDYFIIRGIDAFPRNTLSVFNRWGQLVFDTNDYRNDWDGRSNNGNILPDGTYFVVFKVVGDSKVFKTYLDLRR